MISHLNRKKFIMNKILDVQEILRLLPHRYPFLLVDKVIELQANKSLVAVKNVTMNEQFFNGHFPVKPVMPGVLILEALAQAAAILAYVTLDITASDALFYLGSIDNARFKKIVSPGDQLHLHVEIEKRRTSVWKFKAQALVDGKVVCSADMTSAEGKISS
ncbi:MAG: 3-hydroxyacyl-[acyl-carrier-protein] dehydratase FabZ [Francisellaceae bacterium]|nr:3-hydroxyacyl-[acyl-carrier-protein] dehydratase FabZ [Francisellaceae bacterium]